ncbi:cytochrome P450 6a8 [Armadillidium vulgare]|nr:cytochrome P450 6a8 [Armadillidium vulgare]
MGKSKLVPSIQHEATEFVKIMKKQAGTPAPIPNALTPAIFNVLWQMVASKSYEFDDQELVDIGNLLNEIRENFAPFFMLDIFPWVKIILPEFVLNFVTKKDKFTALSKLLESKLTFKDLVNCIADLFVGGLDSTSNSIIWAIFYLAKFPEVQKKVQEEMDEFVPRETLVTLEHKSSVFDGGFRYSSLAPFGAFHSSLLTQSSLVTQSLRCSIISPTYSSIHFDPKYFDSPKEFRPERFLTPEGKFENPKEGFFPFGNGKRQCLGESLARTEIFIFLVTMMQELQFSVPSNKTLDLKPLAIL